MQKRHHKIHTQQTAVIDLWELLKELLFASQHRKKKAGFDYVDEYGDPVVARAKDVVFAQDAAYQLARWKENTKNGTHLCKLVEGDANGFGGSRDVNFKTVYQQARKTKDDAQRLRLFQQWNIERARELRAEGTQMVFIPCDPSPGPEINLDL